MTEYLEAGAEISPCGLYRYVLSRAWDDAKGAVAFCMLNPSTADGREDDPTIRRCVAFAKRWGYGRLAVVNLFAFRATDPKDMHAAADPVGPENDHFIRTHCAGRLVVCAWGGGVFGPYARPSLSGRPAAVRKILAAEALGVCHLGLTRAGHPKHPLARGQHRVPDDATPQPFPESL